MSAQAELEVNQRNTKAFIDANPVELVLRTRIRTNTGSGVKEEEGPQRDPQIFRLIDQTRTSGPEPGTVQANDGVQRKIEYQLLGVHDAVIGLYDFWVDSAGIRFEVADLIPFNGYEVRAQVIRYGEG